MDDDGCLYCKLSKFGNFHYKIADLEGGELYVLEESIRQKKLLPCQPLYPLDPAFDLWKEVYATLDEEIYGEELESYNYLAIPPIIYSTHQAFFDLKASAFLALGGHYRSAIQLLRPVLENIMVSRYFQEKLLHAEDETWKEEYNKFIDWSESTEHKEGFKKSLKDLKTKGIIISDSEEEKWLNEEWGKLNKYLHPYMFRWDKGKTPEVVNYDEGKYNEWLDMYQNILSYMIEILCNYFQEYIKSENGQNALIELKGMESLEEDCEVTLIKSKHLRNFLSQISIEGSLLQEKLPNSLLSCPTWMKSQGSDKIS